jgi:hypothetical protein
VAGEQNGYAVLLEHGHYGNTGQISP